jgi:serpin B
MSETMFCTSQKHLSVDVAAVTFPNPAIEIINEHIAKATHEMIPEAFDHGTINADSAFLITNVLYLHGQWVTKFNSKATRLEPFTPFDGSTIETQIMRTTCTVPYVRNMWAQLVFLPYKDSSCQFVAILPEDKTEDGFRDTLMELGPSWFDSQNDAQVHLRLPKFRIMGPTVSFNAVAKELGLKKVFEAEEPIFPQMYGGLQMGDITQQVTVEVDEVGTKGAIVGAAAARKCLPPPVVHVNLDRPFAYLIRDRVTGTILLMATYLNPPGDGTSG